MSPPPVAMTTSERHVEIPWYQLASHNLDRASNHARSKERAPRNLFRVTGAVEREARYAPHEVGSRRRVGKVGLLPRTVTRTIRGLIQNEFVEASVRKIIHVDMDAFYASVEQRDNPWTHRAQPSKLLSSINDRPLCFPVGELRAAPLCSATIAALTASCADVTGGASSTA